MPEKLYAAGYLLEDREYGFFFGPTPNLNEMYPTLPLTPDNNEMEIHLVELTSENGAHHNPLYKWDRESELWEPIKEKEMRPIVVVQNRKELPDACFNLIFNRLAFSWKGKIYSKVSTFKGGLVPYIDIGDFRYIAQNPNKMSDWGQMSRDGYKILWIIRKSDNKWMGRMINGQLKRID